MTEPRRRALIGGRYRLVRLLGQGSMGAVWEAHDPRRGAVAVKLVKVAGTEQRKRLRREARLLATIDGEHVCRTYDAGRDGAGGAFVVLELLNGQTLAERLDRDGRLTVPEAAQVFEQVSRGLASAHGVGVVHRDLKPANVFLHQSDGGRETVKLVDFGLAKHLEVAGRDGLPTLTKSDTLLGTLAYMAPEQVHAPRDVDQRADLYSLGAMMFHALAGRPVFRANRPGALLALKLDQDAPSLQEVTGRRWPGPLEELLRRLLARDPAVRPANATAVLRAWRAAMASACP